ncbi:hypothetical protein BJ165DRAFT_1501440 [Panaeolus papilionaceus]|nr:hypothetical protein BJ165DRAFT_1501440 [Panaeolus papilionaceus]
MELTHLITPPSTSYAAFHGHLLALTVVVAAGIASSQVATLVLTPPIARTSAPHDAFKGHLLVPGATDASGNVVVDCRRSFGWG